MWILFKIYIVLRCLIKINVLRITRLSILKIMLIIINN